MFELVWLVQSIFGCSNFSSVSRAMHESTDCMEQDGRRERQEAQCMTDFHRGINLDFVFVGFTDYFGHSEIVFHNASTASYTWLRNIDGG